MASSNAFQPGEGPVFRRDWSKHTPEIVSSKGVTLTDSEGRTYLDSVSGIYVTNVGYGVASIGEAMAAQAMKIPFVYAGDFATAPESTLARRLVELAPPGFEKAYFVSGGSEANEVAFKVARKYQRAKGRDGRWRIASRWQSYHGATMATLAASGKVSRRSDFHPYMLDFPKLPALNPYRRPEGMSLEEYGAACVAEIEQRILQEAPETLAAIIVEPVTGAGSGAIAPPPGYMKGLRALCDRFDLILIADEVVAGFGRTGTMFACEQLDGLPDIITFGKGVASGYAPLAGLLINEKVMDVLRGDTPHKLFTGYTYSGHAVSCAAGLEVVEIYGREGYVGKVASESDWLFETLRARLDFKSVGDIRGRGWLAGIEFVSDRKTRAPYDPSVKFYQKVIAEARSRDLLIRGENGCINGIDGDHLVFAPAFCSSRDELEDMIDRIAASIAAAEAKL